VLVGVLLLAGCCCRESFLILFHLWGHDICRATGASPCGDDRTGLAYPRRDLSPARCGCHRVRCASESVRRLRDVIADLPLGYGPPVVRLTLTPCVRAALSYEDHGRRSAGSVQRPDLFLVVAAKVVNVLQVNVMDELHGT
jgi:hypothetical protein